MRIETTVPIDYHSVADIREFIADLAADTPMSEEDLEVITLAVDEACTNIIKHSYEEKKRGFIKVRATYDENKGELAITLIDKGKRFNITRYEPISLRDYVMKKKTSGLGVSLIRKVMDDVKYRYSEEIGNELILVKKIKP